MPRLPGPEQLGGLPSMRSGRTTPTVGNLDTGASAIAKGLGAVGDAMVGIAAAQEKNEDYEVEKTLIEFHRDRQRDLEEQRRNMQPGGDGFSDAWRTSYDSQARAVFKNLQDRGYSPRALQRLDVGLIRSSEGLHTSANLHELNERDRFHKEEVNNTLTGLMRDAASDPDNLETYRTAGLSQIENSRMNAADKYAVRRAFQTKIEDEVRAAIVNGVDSGPAAAAARRRVVGDDLPARPAGRDRSGSDFMPGSRLPLGSRRNNGAAPPVVPPDQRGVREERALGGPLDVPTEPNDAYGLTEPPVPRNRAGAPVVFREAAGKGPSALGVAERYLGRTEQQHAPVLAEFFRRAGGQNLDPAQTAWCMAFVNAALGEAGGQGTGTLAARDALRLGKATTEPKEGDIVVLSRGDPNGWQGHVGFYVGRNRDGSIRVLGGNQDDGRVSVSSFPADRVLGFRTDIQAGTPVPGVQIAAGPTRTAQGPAATRTDATAAPAAGPITDTTTIATGPRLPGRAGSSAWANAALDAEDRGERPNRGILVNTTGAQRRATLRAIDARERQLIAPLTQQITRWETGAADGILPRDAEIAQVQEQVEAFDDPALTAHFLSVVDLAQLTREKRMLPPPALEEEIRQERRRQTVEGASDIAQRRLRHMQTLLDRARTRIENDPNGWAHDVGFADFSQPPNFGDDASMADHAERARAVGRHLGQPPRFFSPNQRAALTDMARAGGDTMLSVVGSMVRNWGADAPRAIAEFAKDDPELAYIGGMYLDAQRAGGANMQAVRDAARGAELRRDENFKKIMSKILPSNTELEAVASSAVDTAFRASPQTMAAAINTTNLIYMARASQKGITAWGERVWRQAFREALGENTANGHTYGGIYHQQRGMFGGEAGLPIIVPSHIRQDAVGELVGSLRAEDLIDPFGEGPMTGPTVSPRGYTLPGTPLSMAALRNAKLVSVGDGRYWMATGDLRTDQPMWVKNSRGENYVLDLNRLEPILRQRRPELYLGYVEPVRRPEPDVLAPPVAP